MSSWGKKAMAWLGFKRKKGKKPKEAQAVRVAVGKTDAAAREEARKKKRDAMAALGGKGQVDFTGTFGGGGGGNLIG